MMQDYAFTKHRIFQWIGIILAFSLIAIGYWYYQSQASTINKSPTGSLTSGLVGYWTFDGADTSSTTATDRGSGGNNGTLTGGVAAINGPIGQALDFDGTDDYVTVADDNDLDFGDTADFTISGWFYRDTDTTTDMVVTKKNGLTSSHTGYAVYIDATSDKLVLEICDGADEYLLTSSTVFAAGSGWIHFIIIWDQDSATGSEIYINGIANNAVDSGDAIGSLGDLSQTIAFRVGAEGDDGNPFDGKIDDVRIYNTVLTATQIQSLYALGQSDPINSSISQPQGTGRLDSDIAGYWALDDGSGSSAADRSTNGLTGTLSGTPTWTTGQVAGAIDFDGSDDYVSYATNIPFNSEDFSISARIRRDGSGGGADGTSMIFAQRISATGNGQPAVGLYLDSSHRPAFSIRDNVGAGTTINSSTATTVSQWYHVVGVKTSSQVLLYVDNVLVASSSHSLSGDFDAGATVRNIGKTFYDALDYAFFNGIIDDVRVYKRALATSEIAQLSTLTSSTGVDASLKGYWSFNAQDMRSTAAYDRSGAGNTGTLTNGPAVVEGKIGQGLNFFPNGSDTNAYVSMGDPSSGVLDFDSGDFSVSFWMKGAGYYSGGSSVNVPVCKKSIDSVGPAGYCFLYTSANLMNIRVGNGTSDFEVVAPTATTNDNQWHHYVGLRSGSTVYLYIDGQSVGSVAVSGAMSNSNFFYVGSDVTTSRNVNGIVDEVRAYNRALTAAEIKSLYDVGADDKINSSVSQPQGTGRLDSGLAGYWAMDNGSGTSATDSSTNGLTGTLTNGPTWTTGQVGGAVDFDGTDDYVTVADNAVNSVTGAITVSAWIKNDLASATANKGIVAKWIGLSGGSAVDQRSYQIALDFQTDNNNPKAQFLISSYGTSSAIATATSTTTIGTSSWYHISGVFVPSVSATIYVNGVKEAEDTSSVPSAIYNSTSSLNIGNQYCLSTCSGSSYYFDGKIDEARVYNRALSTDEVSQLYRLTSPTSLDTGLKGYWSFNGKDMSGSTVYDRSGAGNTATLTNGPAITEGKIGQALLFDGSNDYVGLGDMSSLEDQGQITLSAWVKPNALGGYKCIFCKQFNGSNEFSLITGSGSEASGGESMIMFIMRNGSNTYGYTTSINQIGVGQWTHVVGVFDGSQSGNANRLKIYINSVQQSLTFSGTIPATTNSNSIDMTIGGTSTAGYFNATLDEMRAYNQALSAAQITALYNQGR